MIVRCPTCQDCIEVSDPNAREADCPAYGVVFNIRPVNKRCRICGIDVSQAKRKRDTLGHYYCQSCSAQQVLAGRAVELTPVVARHQDPGTEALARAIGEQLPGRLGIEHGPAPIVVYVASQPRESRERSRGSFLAGFFGTAGVL